MEQNVKDLVIIGGGPAGLSAAIYGKRAMLDMVVIEKDVYAGGQIGITDRVDNYPGLYGINGYELAMKFKEHAGELNVLFEEGDVLSITDGDVKEINLADGRIIKTKTIILATGAAHKTLGCEGEKEFTGVGVSYCATCDGAFFRNKTVAVVGGGNVALGEALYLSNICSKVYLVHRRDELRGAKEQQRQISEKENIEFIPNSVVKEIAGEGMVNKLTLMDTVSGELIDKDVDGVFIAVGMKPNSELLEGIVETDDAGYIVADESCRTSCKGIYAVGDIRTKQLRQLVTAVADGANAITSIEQDNIL